MSLVKLVDFGVLVIGVVLVVTHYSGGLLTPPVLSGIAFALIGLRQFVR